MMPFLGQMELRSDVFSAALLSYFFQGIGILRLLTYIFIMTLWLVYQCSAVEVWMTYDSNLWLTLLFYSEKGLLKLSPCR
jgi:hypothetical protein